MSNNSTFELKCHFNRILLINLDENQGTYSNIPDKYYKNYSQFYIIIVCSQNSLSGTKQHFHEEFQKFIKKNHDFDLLSKVDATRQGDRMTTTFKGRKNNYNVRTRVYYRKNMVHLLFNPKKFLNSYNRTKTVQITRWNSENNRQSDKSINIKPNDFEKYPLIMNSYNIYRQTYHKEGQGLICVNLNFNLLNGEILSILVINENKKINNMNGGAGNQVKPLLTKNTFITKFELENNKLFITRCTTKGINNNNNYKLMTIKNNNIKYNINNIPDTRLLFKIYYMNKILENITKEEFKTHYNEIIDNIDIVKKYVDKDKSENFESLINQLISNQNRNIQKKAQNIQSKIIDSGLIIILSTSK